MYKLSPLQDAEAFLRQSNELFPPELYPYAKGDDVSVTRTHDQKRIPAVVLNASSNNLKVRTNDGKTLQYEAPDAGSVMPDRFHYIQPVAHTPSLRESRIWIRKYLVQRDKIELCEDSDAEEPSEHRQHPLTFPTRALSEKHGWSVLLVGPCSILVGYRCAQILDLIHEPDDASVRGVSGEHYFIYTNCDNPSSASAMVDESIRQMLDWVTEASVSVRAMLSLRVQAVEENYTVEGLWTETICSQLCTQEGYTMTLMPGTTERVMVEGCKEAELIDALKRSMQELCISQREINKDITGVYRLSYSGPSGRNTGDGSLWHSPPTGIAITGPEGSTPFLVGFLENYSVLNSITGTYPVQPAGIVSRNSRTPGQAYADASSGGGRFYSKADRHYLGDLNIAELPAEEHAREHALSVVRSLNHHNLARRFLNLPCQCKSGTHTAVIKLANAPIWVEGEDVKIEGTGESVLSQLVGPLFPNPIPMDPSTRPIVLDTDAEIRIGIHVERTQGKAFQISWGRTPRAKTTRHLKDLTKDASTAIRSLFQSDPGDVDVEGFDGMTLRPGEALPICHLGVQQVLQIGLGKGCVIKDIENLAAVLNSESVSCSLCNECAEQIGQVAPGVFSISIKPGRVHAVLQTPWRASQPQRVRPSERLSVQDTSKVTLALGDNDAHIQRLAALFETCNIPQNIQGYLGNHITEHSCLLREDALTSFREALERCNPTCTIFAEAFLAVAPACKKNNLTWVIHVADFMNDNFLEVPYKYTEDITFFAQLCAELLLSELLKSKEDDCNKLRYASYMRGFVSTAPHERLWRAKTETERKAAKSELAQHLKRQIFSASSVQTVLRVLAKAPKDKHELRGLRQFLQALKQAPLCACAERDQWLAVPLAESTHMDDVSVLAPLKRLQGHAENPKKASYILNTLAQCDGNCQKVIKLMLVAWGRAESYIPLDEEAGTWTAEKIIIFASLTKKWTVWESVLTFQHEVMSLRHVQVTLTLLRDHGRKHSDYYGALTQRGVVPVNNVSVENRKLRALAQTKQGIPLPGSIRHRKSIHHGDDALLLMLHNFHDLAGLLLGSLCDNQTRIIHDSSRLGSVTRGDHDVVVDERHEEIHTLPDALSPEIKTLVCHGALSDSALTAGSLKRRWIFV